MKNMQSCASDDAINKENADSIWTRPLRGGNGRYSWILRTLCYHVNEEILVQSCLSLSF